MKARPSSNVASPSKPKRVMDAQPPVASTGSPDISAHCASEPSPRAFPSEEIEGLQRHPRYGARVEPCTYGNMFDALYRIPRLEGWLGLYKGIVPSTIKALPAGAVTFFVVELTSHWFESTFS